MVSLLQGISRKLRAAISEKRLTPIMREALGVGAGGDRTFAIDRLSEDIIISELEAAAFPCSVISEEAGFIEINGGGKKVLIDPIDGSRNAISGLPFYCTSIAIASGDTIGSIEAACVVNLISGDEFMAEKGKGAFINDEKISAQKGDELNLVAYEAQTPGPDIDRILPLLAKAHKTRCFGATALDLAYLAYGAISVFATPSHTRSFDFGGGWLLVKEAGGIVTDINGKDIKDTALGLERTATLLASGNQKLHDKALSILN